MSTCRVLLLASLCVALCACVTPAPAPAPVAEPPPSGRVSGELLVDPATPADEPEVDEVHEPPMQRAGNEMPHYPADWIAAHLPAQSVSVRIVVDREGKVARVEPIAPLLVGAHADAFQAATTSAVQAWSFEPFRVIHWVDGPDKNGDGIADSQEVGSMEARPFRFDMRFHFELVDGVPRVH